MSSLVLDEENHDLSVYDEVPAAGGGQGANGGTGEIPDLASLSSESSLGMLDPRMVVLSNRKAPLILTELGPAVGNNAARIRHWIAEYQSFILETRCELLKANGSALFGAEVVLELQAIYRRHQRELSHEKSRIWWEAASLRDVLTLLRAEFWRPTVGAASEGKRLVEVKQMIQSMATVTSAVPPGTTEGTYHFICVYGAVEDFIRKFAGKVEDAYPGCWKPGVFINAELCKTFLEKMPLHLKVSTQRRVLARHTERTLGGAKDDLYAVVSQVQTLLWELSDFVTGGADPGFDVISAGVDDICLEVIKLRKRNAELEALVKPRTDKGHGKDKAKHSMPEGSAAGAGQVPPRPSGIGCFYCGSMTCQPGTAEKEKCKKRDRTTFTEEEKKKGAEHRAAADRAKGTAPPQKTK